MATSTSFCIALLFLVASTSAAGQYGFEYVYAYISADEAPAPVAENSYEYTYVMEDMPAASDSKQLETCSCEIVLDLTVDIDEAVDPNVIALSVQSFSTATLGLTSSVTIPTNPVTIHTTTHTSTHTSTTPHSTHTPTNGTTSTHHGSSNSSSHTSTTTHSTTHTSVHTPTNSTVHTTTVHTPTNSTVHTPSVHTVHTPSNTTVHTPTVTTVHTPTVTTVHTPSNTTVTTVHTATAASVHTAHTPDTPSVSVMSNTTVHETSPHVATVSGMGAGTVHGSAHVSTVSVTTVHTVHNSSESTPHSASSHGMGSTSTPSVTTVHSVHSVHNSTTGSASSPHASATAHTVHSVTGHVSTISIPSVHSESSSMGMSMKKDNMMKVIQELQMVVALELDCDADLDAVAATFVTTEATDSYAASLSANSVVANVASSGCSDCDDVLSTIAGLTCASMTPDDDTCELISQGVVCTADDGVTDTEPEAPMKGLWTTEKQCIDLSSSNNSDLVDYLTAYCVDSAAP